MEIRKVYTEGRHLSFEAHCQWKELLFPKGYNWTNFTIVNLGWENDKIMGNFELEFGLLGFDFRLIIGYTKTEVARNLEEAERKIQAGELDDFEEW